MNLILQKPFKKVIFALLCSFASFTSSYSQNEIFHLTLDGSVASNESENPVFYSFLQGTEAYSMGQINQGMYVTSSEYLIYSTANNINSQQGTLEFWLKPDNWLPNGEYTILEYGGSGGMLFEKDAANHLRLIINRHAVNAQPEVDVAYNQSWDSNLWYHVAYSWGSDSLKLYVNGNLVDYDVYGFPFPTITNSSFNIGSDGLGYFGGLNAYLDDLIIYDTVKTAAQIYNSYQTGIGHVNPIVCDNPLLYLSFDYSLVGAEGEVPTNASSIDFISGYVNGALSFTPETELRYEKANNFNEYEGSLEFWVNPSNNWLSNEEYTILECGGSGGMIFEKDGANNLRLIINRFSVNGQPEVDVAYNVYQWNLNEWYHVVYTWGNGNLGLYVNGILVDSDNYGSYSFPAITASHFRIGDDDVHGEGPLRASLDELSIYGCELSTIEIDNNYQNGIAATTYTTSVITESRNKNVAIKPYPNPATTAINFDLSTLEGENASIEIIDQTGKSLITVASDGQTISSVDISSLQKGFYFTKILVDEKVISTSKLMVY